jgi:hypothetical protein
VHAAHAAATAKTARSRRADAQDAEPGVAVIQPVLELISTAVVRGFLQ